MGVTKYRMHTYTHRYSSAIYGPILEDDKGKALPTSRADKWPNSAMAAATAGTTQMHRKERLDEGLTPMG